MGFWPTRVYRRYVEAHAGTARHELLHPEGELFADSKFGNILIKYDSMPAWMRHSNLITLDNNDARFRAQNEAHFRRLLHVYRSDAADYTRAVKSRLNQILERLTGAALLAELGATDSDLDIVPNWESRVNSHTTANDGAHATARGKLIEYGDPDDLSVGEGGGSDSTIEFTPGMYTGSIMAREAKAPDEVLFHELVHASRQMRGVEDSIPVNAGYADQEEYLAVVLTNIYLSEKGQWRFRASHGHWGDDEVPKGANALLQGGDADWFIRNVQHVNLSPRQLMENFKRSQPRFFDALAHLPPERPKFNPVRQYFKEQQGAFTM
jgi:Effector protein